MTLPRQRPTALRELIRFDLTIGLPTAVSVLRRRLSPLATARVVGRVITGGLRDPLSGLANAEWPADKEKLVRYQLRSAVLLDDALMRERALSEDARIEVLSDVVSQTGARFVQYITSFPDVAAWRAASEAERRGYVDGSVQRFFNIATRNHTVEDAALSFDVCECRFVPLVRELGRPYLAKMFCEADTVYFSQPDAPVRLRRSGTLAGGASHCDFRFEYDGR
jgi:hypothetical protein